MVINLWVLCIEDGTGQHRLIKNWKHHPISVKVHSLDSTSLILLVEDFCVLISVNTEVFEIPHRLHTDPMDGNGGRWSCWPIHAHNPFLSLCYIRMQVVFLQCVTKFPVSNS